MQHTGPGHEAALAALGGPDVRAAFRRSDLAACPACAQMLELEGELDSLGAAERAALETSAAAPPALGPAERALRERMQGAGARPGGRRAVPWLLVAAAAVVLLVLGPRLLRPPAPAVDPQLGRSFELLQPLGAAASFDDFRWTSAPGAAWYRVTVQALDPDAHGARSDSGRITGTSWQPSREERERWGTRIRWTVEAYRATGAGDLIDSQSASAERSSR